MNDNITMPRLVDRKTLCRVLGNVSLSHIVRLDRDGRLNRARIQVGERAIRYDLGTVRRLIAGRNLV